MKKILLTLGIACLGLTVNSYAQTIVMTQNFESPTVAPALPSTWSQVSSGTPGWFTSSNAGTTWGSLTGLNNIPAHTQYVVVDDAAHPVNLNDTLKSPTFSLTGLTGVYLSYDFYFYEAQLVSNSRLEHCYILGSSNGGTTWALMDSIIGNAFNVDSWSTNDLSLSSLSGANCRVAFVYGDQGSSILGCALDNITVFVPPANDLDFVALSPTAGAPNSYGAANSNFTLNGTVQNNGSVTVTSFNVSYQLGTAAVVTNTISGVSIAGFGTYNFTDAVALPATTGTYPLTVWVTIPNDANLHNDTLTSSLIVVDSLMPKTVMIEEFNQASCDPCAEATPNVDSVYVNSSNICILLRYHVNFPGRDCMDSVTLDPFVQAQLSFYNVTGVPDAQVDGSYVYPGAAGPGSLSSPLLQAEAASGSPFKLAVTPAYNPATNTYSFSAAVTSYAPMAAGLKLRAALSVDTITYALNQSTESIPQYVFPEVAENMFPNAGGSTLTAFTAGSTQTVTGSWVKNHPWGSDYAVWKYDSTDYAKIVVWVEDDNALYVYQAAQATVVAVTNLGVNNVAGNNGSMNVYPNPASRTATVVLNLKSGADVKMEVMNTLGQVVYSMPVENRNAGNSSSTIDVSNFAAGQYFVKDSIGTEVLTKQLTVIK